MNTELISRRSSCDLKCRWCLLCSKVHAKAQRKCKNAKNKILSALCAPLRLCVKNKKGCPFGQPCNLLKRLLTLTSFLHRRLRHLPFSSSGQQAHQGHPGLLFLPCFG